METFNSSDINLIDTSRVLPLINRTAVWLYTFQYLLTPGPQDVFLSTLPFYHIVLYTCSLIIWIVVLIYFWKFVYFQVDDPYATPYGSAYPYEKRTSESFWNSNKILEYISQFAEKISDFGVS